MPHKIGVQVIPPVHRAWDPDDSVDFHASRLLLLIHLCGDNPGPYIEGRTKFAKLDFFLRYPGFLERAHAALPQTAGQPSAFVASDAAEIEAPMIRYRYGPWDHRYRQFLSFLTARKLVTVTVSHTPERVKLTSAGKATAARLAGMEQFEPLVRRCEAMRGNLAAMSGTDLKNLIYDLFPDEITNASFHQEIRP
ncbi:MULTISPECIES: hypothetical protein [Streptomyces]|uniref:Uncharacterized protein n=2 Tax=Streptomyces TaxID=1883 RepID=A0A117IUC1_9ACTN|nr:MULTISPECIES: hypothetical protein [Streptomyces]KUH35315.1 hypothetical protein ATE80_29965 [Streptomyces kanasensis]UUS34033.1 hypothetical protein NRO40_26530 [Streptomyces changanensis]